MEPKARIWLFILMSFLLGAIGGLIVGKTYYGAQAGRHPSHEEIRRQFSERLKLDAQQRSVVDTVLETQRAKFSDLRKRYSERVKMQRDTLRTEIRKILSPDQNKLYDDFIKEMEDREAKQHEKHDKD